MHRTSAPSFVLLTVAAALGACSAPRPAPLTLVRSADDLARDVRAVVAELGPDVRAAVWLSAPLGPPALAWNVDAPMPVASAIKVAYLVELFDAHADRLDAPLRRADEILADAAHPAVAHFEVAQRDAAAAALAQASVRRIGEVMITGKGVDNATYNVAANLVTADCGGPAWLQAKLHARDASWQGLAVRRYMLANRKEHGDNEATARSLAAVHGMLAVQRVPRADARAVAAARAVLALPDAADGLHRFAKGGSLDSAPITRVAAGWREGPHGAVVYVVMLAEAGDVNTAGRDAAAAGQRFARAVQRIEDLLLAAAQ